MKQGEIIQLGEHTLGCGNSQDPEFIAKLMGKNKIRIVLTDPPYGVSYVENKDWLGLGKVVKQHKKIENDNLTGIDYTEFSRKWLEPILPHLEPKNAFYIFNSDLCFCELRKGMELAGIKYSQLIIWIKNQTVLGRKDYNPQHELIAYGWHGTHKFERSKQKSVIFCPKTKKNTLHPTMKPVSLLRRFIVNSTKIGDTIFDPFGGSGSTLIACEQTKRKCIMVELDGDYCDIIKQRYEKLIK